MAFNVIARCFERAFGKVLPRKVKSPARRFSLMNNEFAVICIMENYTKAIRDARKVEDGLRLLSEILQNPTNIGNGKNAKLQLSRIEEIITFHETNIESTTAALKQNVKQQNELILQKDDTLSRLTAEIQKIAELGEDVGFFIPENLVSPRMSPQHMSPNGTPLSSRSTY